MPDSLCARILSPSIYFPSVLFTDPTLTPENLLLVLDHLPYLDTWKEFALVANVPKSLVENISELYTSNKDFKDALVHLFISKHPAPSWSLVARALYRVRLGTRKTLAFLQQHFSTGIQFINFLLVLSICIIIVQ